ncbi:MAG TPA: filamentous hemagglutinin family protein [Steroidobacteraceae bacterium]|nr:filamentous hemagglutinin family protein [Steroidobacteraceae bacterium]
MHVVKKLGVAAIAAVVQALSQPRSEAAELPIPCVAGSCGPNVAAFRQSGQATATSAGNTLTVNQTTDRVILNWQSFNVGADGRVVFQQPDSSSIALNRIHQGSPSRIFGAVEANGQIYLVNQNGIVFGSTARVKTAGLVASTLNISDEVFAAGIVAPELAANGRPSLEGTRAIVLDSDGNQVTGPDGQPLEVVLRVDAGAKIQTTAGGRVILASRTVDNAGSIETPDGQTLIAAGEKVYLQASGDPSLRGLLVEVDTSSTAWNRVTSGTATNRATGEISARRGNVTIAGLAVNQEGRISATTSVSANGSIRLLGRDTMVASSSTTDLPRIGATRGGTVTLGATSRTEVLPELADTTTALDDQVQVPSSVELSGRRIDLLGGARITAPGGTVTVQARANPSVVGHDADARIRMNTGAVIDVSGSTASASVERNLVTVELRANELRDSPLQRNGVLRGKPVVVDARVGTPLADVSGALAATPRDIAERTSRGGTVSFGSDGDVGIANDATIDVSGGAIVYRPGIIQTTRLVAANGQVVDIGQADPNQQYVGLVNPTVTRTFDRWGVKETVAGPRTGQYDPGYTEGRSAGTLQISAGGGMVLNGTFLGHATPGLYQRDPSTIPAGGSLILGQRIPDGDSLDFLAPSVTLSNVRPTLSFGPSGAIPASVPVGLSTDFLTTGGFTTAQISSNGVVSLREGAPLTLAPGSTLDFRGSAIAIGSDITDNAGTLRFTADRTALNETSHATPSVGVADGVTLDVRGRWQNDLLDATGTIYRNGGTIDLAARSIPSAAGALSLGDGVRLLASGGASMAANGTITGGTGGAIALRSGGDRARFTIGENVTLEAFGVQGAKGGSFTLEAPVVQIGNGPRWAEAQTFDAAADLDGSLRLGNALFTDHGFASFTVVATGAARPARDADGAEDPGAAANPDVLTVTSGTTIRPRIDTLQIGDGANFQAAAANVAAFAARLQVPEWQAAPASITLRADPRFEPTATTQAGRLHLEEGSLVTGAPRSTFTFASAGGMLLEGQVYSAGGTITAQTTTPADRYDRGYLPDLAIDVASTARLDVSGSVVLKPSDSGLRQGDVIGGGAINLLADRGSVLLRSGSVLDVSGTAGTLDLATSRGFAAQTIASAGGSVAVRAPESILLGGEMHAAAGSGGALRPAGGSLDLQLTRQRDFAFGPVDLRETYPDTPRNIRVIPDAFAGVPANGVAVLQAPDVSRSGFDALHVYTDRLSFDPGVSLDLAREIRLESPVIDVAPGAPTVLNAAYVSLGAARDATPSAVAGGGRLNVTADLIDVVGTLNLERSAATRLDSRGDIRLRGFAVSGQSNGTLTTAGDLTLAAQRVYPTTLTSFTIDAGDSRVTLARTGTNDATPLSAGGRVTIRGGDIVQNGALFAPFGGIELQGTDSVSLGAGSLTSVSAAGTVLPFGHIELGKWVYTLGGTAVEQTAIPERTVEISAGDVSIEGNATIDLRGGGDLYAYDWLPGTGGSRDVLDAAQNNGYYAILPAVGPYAPFDPQEFVGSALKPGDSVTLSGGGGLPAGTYALLPARYALLPGAYLVRRVNGTTDLTAAGNTRLIDGSTLVSGYRSVANAGVGESRTTGFAILPGTAARDLASYNDYRASTFFDARAKRLDLQSVARTADAGYLGLFATQNLALGGNVRAGAATGGQGARVDIAAQALELGTGAARQAGAVRIDANTVGAWNAASVLFGGRRSADGKSIEALSDSLLIDTGSAIDAAELIMVANRSIDVATGASLTSSAAPGSALALEPREIELTSASGDSPALLAVSNNGVLRSTATGSGVAARIDLAAGSRLAARGSVTIDAPAGATLDGTLSVAGADVLLRSRNLVFGATPADEVPLEGIQVGDALLRQISGAGALRFVSDGIIDFQEALALGDAEHPLGNLELAATEIRAHDRETVVDGETRITGSAISLFARDFVLRGGASQTVAGAGGKSTFSVSADNVAFDGGFLDFNGFGAISLAARGDLAAKDTTVVRAPGNVTLAANRLIGETAASLRVDAGNDMTLGRAAKPIANATLPGLGASFAFGARDLAYDGSAWLPSGLVSLAATRNLSLGEGARIDVAGRDVGIATHPVGTPGGTIRLSAGGTVSSAATSMLAAAGALDAADGTLDVRGAGAVSLGGAMSGGTFRLDAGTLADLDGLATRLGAGGFGDRRDVRVRSGNLLVGKGSSWAARHVSLAADTGRVDVSGSIAATSGNERATIDLSGGAGVTLNAGASLSARGDDGLGRGGSVTIAASGGRVDLAPDSVIDVTGAKEPGSVSVRARAFEDTNEVAIDRLAANVFGAAALTIVPTLVIDKDDTPDVIDAAGLAGFADRLRNWLAASDAGVRARLVTPDGIALRVSPGLEFQSERDLAISAMDFSSWRFNGEPAEITFRTTGSIQIANAGTNAFFGDGFTTVGVGTTARNDLRADRSTTLRLIAGADLSAANTETTARDSASDLTLNNVSVRSGTGDITLAAARDVVFNGNSSVYTAGNAGAPSINIPRGPIAVYATGGGNVTVRAGRDVLGSQVIQAVGDWQPRQGRGTTTSPVRWGADIRAFRWNAGTLGGGDLTMSAGRDLRDLTAATADAGYQRADGTLSHFDGGVMTLDAGGDISSPFLHVTAGDNRVTAGGGLTTSRIANDGSALGALFSMQDARLSIVARDSIALETIFNPTMLTQPATLAANRVFFFTYGENAGFSATSLTGDISTSFEKLRLGSYLGGSVGDSNEAYQLLPPSLALRSLSGDLLLAAAPYLFPSSRSSLELFAARDVRMNDALRMSDATALSLPGALATATNGNIDALTGATTLALRHLNDDTPNRITAGRDVVGGRYWLSKFTELTAGRDVVDVTMRAQNLRAGDATRVIAGRDVRLAEETATLEVGGPGRFDILAGRDIDLGFSQGIATTGRLRNQALPARGADVTAIAGFRQPMDAPTFIEKIIEPTSAYVELLVEYVREVSGDASMDRDTALAQFKLFDAALQRPLLVQVFFRELDLSGNEFTADNATAYQRGYAAIDALFHGSRDPDLENGTPGFVNPYSGNLSLAFSRIYTVGGGDINLLVPGGIVDVGVAVPPVGAPARKPSDLGIVAQRAGDVRIFAENDVLVNASRVFTLGGGDIIIWSTLGDIDAGRGKKSAISAPPPQILIDGAGNVVVDLAGAVAGSGIRGILTDPTLEPGNVNLIAPSGIVNAGDAGIGSAGNLNVAAQQVVGLDNIQVGGASTGVPAETSNLGAALSAVSASSSAASSSATKDAGGAAGPAQKASLADTALGWLDVFLEGFGEEVCKPADTECLDRNRKK